MSAAGARAVHFAVHRGTLARNELDASETPRGCSSRCFVFDAVQPIRTVTWFSMTSTYESDGEMNSALERSAYGASNVIGNGVDALSLIPGE